MAYSILIANPKGGSGKSTLSTNIAGFYASQGTNVMLGDIDKQQSSMSWLARRPAAAARIAGWEMMAGLAKPPKETQVVILDSPAGLDGKALKLLVKKVDRVIVPIQPSPFDMWASGEFFDVLLTEKAVRKEKTFVAVVGMRVDQRTRSARELESFLAQYDVPVLGWIRDTQLYVQAAGMGLSLFDFSLSRVRRDMEAWQPILSWLDN